MKSVNLFGELQDEKYIKEFNGYFQNWKNKNNYKKSDDNRKCKDCKYCAKNMYHNKSYYKCELMGISHSEASDRANHVCNKYACLSEIEKIKPKDIKVVRNG